MTKIPETDSKMQSVHLTAPGPSEVFTTRESLRERCDMFVRCLPQAPMRDRLARLFEDLLADRWLPIETAPQTGYMLVYEDGAIRALFRSDGKWEPPNYPALVSDLWGQNVLVGPDAARVLAPLGFRLEVRDGCCEQPTHWMPLPAAPHHRSAVGAPGSDKPEPASESGSSIAAQGMAQDAARLLRIFQTHLGESRGQCDAPGKRLWDRIDAALRAVPHQPTGARE